MSSNISNEYKFSQEELSIFCYQLGLMMKAGIGSEEGISLIADDADETAKKLLEKVHFHLTDGVSLSVALERTGSFPEYMLRMIEIGQVSGRLDKVLSSLANYYEKRAETSKSIKRAVSYPATMSGLVAIIFLVLVSQVLPVFDQVLSQLGLTLSPLANAMMSFGSSSNIIVGVVIVLVVIIAIVLFYTMRENAYTNIISKTQTGKLLDRSHFTSAMAMMLSSGINTDEAMERAIGLLENSELSEQFKKCHELMDNGERLPDAAGKTGILNRSQTGVLSAGFRAGVPEQAMEELAGRLQIEADEHLERLLGRFEYGLVVALCVVVGIVLLSVMLPLIGVLSSIGG